MRTAKSAKTMAKMAEGWKTPRIRDYIVCPKRDTYTSSLKEMLNQKNFNSVFMDNEKRTKIINNLKSTEKKDINRYRWQKKYEVIEVDDTSVLIKRRVAEGDTIRFVPTVEEMFDILHECHLATNHGGRDKMTKEVSQKYTSVTRQSISLYLTLCEECKLKQRTTPRKSSVPKQLTSNNYTSRCHVDLIDFQNQPDGEYKYVLVYLDHLTNWVQIRPLKSKRAEDVAWKLYKIFTTFGAPALFHTGIGHEFEILVLHRLLSLWPECRLVPGKPRNNKLQSRVAFVNEDIKNRITMVMRDRKTNQWSKLLPHVQINKNRAFHSDSQCTAYESFFGTPFRVGLTGLPMAKEMQLFIVDEDQLLEALNHIQLHGECNFSTDRQRNEHENHPTTSAAEVVTTHFESEVPNCNVESEPICSICSKVCEKDNYCCVCKNTIHTSCGVATGDVTDNTFGGGVGGGGVGGGNYLTCNSCACQGTTQESRTATKRCHVPQGDLSVAASTAVATSMHLGHQIAKKRITQLNEWGGAHH